MGRQTEKNEKKNNQKGNQQFNPKRNIQLRRKSRGIGEGGLGGKRLPVMGRGGM